MENELIKFSEYLNSDPPNNSLIKTYEEIRNSVKRNEVLTKNKYKAITSPTGVNSSEVNIAQNQEFAYHFINGPTKVANRKKTWKNRIFGKPSIQLYNKNSNGARQSRLSRKKRFNVLNEKTMNKLIKERNIIQLRRKEAVNAKRSLADEKLILRMLENEIISRNIPIPPEGQPINTQLAPTNSNNSNKTANVNNQLENQNGTVGRSNRKQ